MFSEIHLMFVYGTLKQGEPNYEHIIKAENGHAQFIGIGRTVKKWPLVIASKYNIPYLIRKEGEGYRIVGEIYEVDDQMRSFLDEFEGHPTYYRRIEEEVVLELTENNNYQKNSTVKCGMYFLESYKPSLLELPLIENYSSYGSHNLEYVSRYKRVATEVYDAEVDIKLAENKY